MTIDQLKKHMEKLLDYEEKVDFLYLTTEERRDFQYGVQALFDDKEEILDKVLGIINKHDQADYYFSVRYDAIQMLLSDIRAEVEALKKGEPE